MATINRTKVELKCLDRNVIVKISRYQSYQSGIEIIV